MVVTCLIYPTVGLDFGGRLPEQESRAGLVVPEGLSMTSGQSNSSCLP